MNQVVGLRCVICRERIVSAAEGRFCDSCDYPVHDHCMRPHRAGSDEDGCPGCGAHLRKTDRRRRRDAHDRDDSRAAGPYPVSKVCPECGHDEYEKRRPKGWVAFVDDRICKKCRTRYTPPTPLWAALVFIVGGLGVALAGVLALLFLLLSIVRAGSRPTAALVELGIGVALIGMGGLATFHGFRCLAKPGKT
jgi:hypothetical protein